MEESQIPQMEDSIMTEHEDETELNIARRTRSHWRIDNYVPDDNLNFPDVDMNLYQNPDSEGDPEYKKFLNQCFSVEIGTDTNTDDNDPEYVYNDDIFSHGWRFDINEAKGFNQQDERMYPDTTETYNDQKSRVIAITEENQLADKQLLDYPHQYESASTSEFRSPNKSGTRKIDMFDKPEFARVLNQQLRQSIQLITQTYLLTKSFSNMQDEAEDARKNLEEYKKIFKNKSKPSNLLPALDLVHNYPRSKELKSSIRLSWRPLAVPENVKEIIRNHREIFIYPSLLPQVAFSILPEKLIPKKPKINFTLNEDKLLAYALNEFKNETSPYAFIASLLMTAKTKTQISNHIKNIKRSPGNESNPIKLFYSKGELPSIDLDSDSYLFEIHIEDDEVAAELESSDKNELSSDQVQLFNCKTETIYEVQQQQQLFLPQPQIQLQPQLQPHSPSQPQPQSHSDSQPQPQLHSQSQPQSHSQPNELEEKHELELNQKQQQKEEEVVGMEEYVMDEQIRIQDADPYQESDDLMNMCLDDLMAASTTISKSAILNASTSENNKNLKNLRLKRSMLSLMSHKFQLPKEMNNLIIQDFLSNAQQKLSENNYLELLKLLTSLMEKEADNNEEANSDTAVAIYQKISEYFSKINAPQELCDKLVLFLDLEQATKCGCAFNYLYWMRFFEFMQHVEMYHDSGLEAFEKKLIRLIDALQKFDQHKIKLAIGNLVNKHPFLMREFDSLSLNEKPHPSFFFCEEDFDDITEPLAMYASESASEEEKKRVCKFEHFSLKLTEEELAYASQSCPCKCHQYTSAPELGHAMQHCNNCNLKFMKGRMYLVNKIKPILAEWSYTDRHATNETSPQKSNLALALQAPKNVTQTHSTTPTANHNIMGPPSTTSSGFEFGPRGDVEWTFEEDKEILEFCRAKAEQSEETMSFDSTTFEELVNNQQRKVHFYEDRGARLNNTKKSAREIADRFNHLMDLYKSETSRVISGSQQNE